MPEPTTWRERLEGALGMRPRRARRRPRAAAGRSASPVRRHPVYGGQAHRDANYPAYMVGFVFIIAILVGFLYVGLNWATDNTRTAGLVVAPTPAPTVAEAPAVAPAVVPSPSPAPEERTYVVKKGDTPVAIARQFGVSVDELLKANNITDPRSLQVGQTLKVPTPPGH
jgi:LysM domain